jgi:hypothetical protein
MKNPKSYDAAINFIQYKINGDQNLKEFKNVTPQAA